MSRAVRHVEIPFMNAASVIRPLVSADADALLRFYRALPPWIVRWFEPFRDPTRDVLEQHLRAAAAGNHVSLGLVDPAGAVLGHAFILGIREPRPVLGIGLCEQAIGHGCGRRLMAALLRAADARELPRVTLTVFKDNPRARHLYETCGFAVTGEHACRAPADSWAMERRGPEGVHPDGHRANLLRLLRGAAPTRPVWTADVTYWMAGEAARGRADPRWDTEDGFLELHARLGILAYYYYPTFGAGAARYDETIEGRTERAAGRTAHILRTPHGELREEHIDLPESATSGCVRHFVQDEHDLDLLLDLLEHRRLVPLNLDDYHARCTRWAARDGLPALGLPRSPLAAFCYEWAGVQNAAYLIADCEDKVRRALALMETQEAPVLEAVCTLAPPLVHFPDNLDSENLTGLYDEFMAATHRRRLERLHAAGIAAAVHLDGAVRGLLPKLVAAGFDAVEALTPQPAGDLDPAAMRALAGSDRVVLWGGMPGVLFAPPYRWADVARHLDGLLAAWAGQPFVVGVADQVPPDGDIGFCAQIAARLARP